MEVRISSIENEEKIEEQREDHVDQREKTELPVGGRRELQGQGDYVVSLCCQ